MMMLLSDYIINVFGGLPDVPVNFQVTLNCDGEVVSCNIELRITSSSELKEENE